MTRHIKHHIGSFNAVPRSLTSPPNISTQTVSSSKLDSLGGLMGLRKQSSPCGIKKRVIIRRAPLVDRSMTSDDKQATTNKVESEKEMNNTNSLYMVCRVTSECPHLDHHMNLNRHVLSLSNRTTRNLVERSRRTMSNYTAMNGDRPGWVQYFEKQLEEDSSAKCE